ncbi:hypothetical protein niasHT_008817 [Heterodera trifolii]|uniref:HAT C-terminal dimerisation domain-containing protein n=1 Tax=Heterodera trifolii TaxID=157864 RepID=A0ABD2LSN3_9BILA
MESSSSTTKSPPTVCSPPFENNSATAKIGGRTTRRWHKWEDEQLGDGTNGRMNNSAMAPMGGRTARRRRNGTMLKMNNRRRQKTTINLKLMDKKRHRLDNSKIKGEKMTNANDPSAHPSSAINKTPPPPVFPSNKERQQQHSSSRTQKKTGTSTLLDEFLDDNSFSEDLYFEVDKDESEIIRREVESYLSEPLQSVDCFVYWSSKAEQWPRLCKLFREFNCAPVGSHESERLFSTEGDIMTDKRNRLSAENLEKLLFLHHNLPQLNYEY